MSLSTSLSSALSGLTATSRAAEVVSSNVANALTEGYGRREIDLIARRTGTTGNGVAVVGVNRSVNQILLSDRRIADSAAADRDVRQAFFAGLESAVGLGDAPGGLSNRIATLETALIAAASRPESAARLNTVLHAAKALTGTLSGAATAVQDARIAADRRIGTEVDQLNTTLRKIDDINDKVRFLSAQGLDTNVLQDTRQRMINDIARIVPLRQIARAQGEVALFTTGGAALLDGRAAQIGFAVTGVITADMTLAGGALSGLTLDGQAISMGSARGLMAGGSLAAQFVVRDDLAVAAQSQLDAMARDLVERFQSPAVDPSLLPGDAGLFTDMGGVFLAANEPGIAQRLSINAAVDPDQGGALWRLRDGIGAVAPGAEGNSALLSALQSALTDRRAPNSGSFLAGSQSFAGLSTAFVSEVATARLSAQSDVSFAQARADTLRRLELEQGVDTDAEMQNLLQIEQAYSANVRVVQTVDDMIRTLLEI